MPGLEAVSPAVQALALLWLLVAVNLLGVRAGGSVQVVTTVLKLLPMAAIILLGAWLLVTEPAAYTRHPPATPITLEGLMAASTIALFAMLGIESAAVPAGRVRDPERTIPRATMVGTLLTAAIYIAVSSIALLLMQQEELAQSSAPFADLLDTFMGAGNGRLLSIFVVISGLGALNGWTLLVSELTASMGRHGFLPRAGRTPELSRRPGRGIAADRRARHRNGPDELQQVAGRRLYVPDAGRDRREPAAVSFLRNCAGCAGASRSSAGCPVTCSCSGLLGTAYSVFAFVGLGREPFLWSLVLGAIGLAVVLADAETE